MSIIGDMSYYVATKTSMTPEKAREIIMLALDAADDPNFAGRFQRQTECTSSFTDYFDVIKFLKEVC
jgi:hypothetical protein